MRKVPILLYCTILVALVISCKENPEKSESVAQYETVIYDFENTEERTAYTALKLDDFHPNLLNPAISGPDAEEVTRAWGDLHQQIGDHLAKNDFDWEIAQPEISILHKFYFNPDGKINSYLFRILDENVTEMKREQYAELMASFVESFKLDLSRDTPYAQCGKTKYVIDSTL